MAEQYINSVHIEKLGHKIPEIRERALQNIISKLDNGVSFDNDMARSRELLNKLLKWFLFEPSTKEEIVFALLKRILLSESGQTLIEHLGKEFIINKLEQIHLYLDPKYLCLLEEILEAVNNYEPQNIVPPLQCDVPLSYRSGESYTEFSPYLGTTATLIEGTLHKQSSIEQQTGAQKHTKSTTQTPFEDASTYRVQDINFVPELNNFPKHFFEWQPLIEPDRHVLNSVENSLINPPQPSSLLHSCEFFHDVLLHDFPAEIFLQRPKIVLELFSLLNCGSSRINNAVLCCLCDLTTELKIRINHCNDPSLQNVKMKHITELSFPNTPISSNKDSENEDFFSEILDKFEKNEDIVRLQKTQISTFKYCFLCINSIFKYLCVKQDLCMDSKMKTNQVAINYCLVILEKNLELISLCLEKQIWDQTQSDTSLNLFKLVNDIFISYGMALEHFRIESVSSENNLKYRGIYLYLLHNIANVLQKLISFSKSATVIPRNLKTALANSLLDVTFSRLYPAVHNLILNYVENFAINEDKDHLKKYEEVKKICQGMSSTVRFLSEHKKLSALENFHLAKEALASVEFHKDFDFLKVYVDLCAEKYSQISDDSNKTTIVEEITLSLLNHAMLDIRQEMYRLCHKIVISYIGPKLNDNTGIIGSQVQFLLTSRIVIEIACYGLDSESYEIQKYAEDILMYLLKCKILASETIWNKIIQSLIPSLPILTCQMSNNSLLCKTVTSLVDPDIAEQSSLPSFSMVKTNIEFLFLDNPYLREEAFSRICWLLSTQENARELLPGINTLYDTSLAGICKIKRVLDVNKIRRTEHFYQPSSLHQVLEVISSSNIEPVIKRSALNQISVMMEDPLLHQIFLDANGLNLVVEVMKSALAEKNYRDYPDSIIPVISILKNICLYHGPVREELSNNIDVYYFTLRGLFLFFTEDRLKQDATILLFLLIFKDFIWGSPSRANFSLPKIVVDKTNLPFICNSHWSVSEYVKSSLRDKIAEDRWCLSSIQIQWNAEIFGGFDELTKLDEIIYEDHSSVYKFGDLLKLTKYDLKCIKNSSIDYCVVHCLQNIQNATSHSRVLESIDHLTMYIHLHKLSSQFNEDYQSENILNHPWETTFLKFLKVLPSCDDDVVLLKRIIQFLCILVTYYTPSGIDCWIISFLKDSSICLLDILTVDETTEDDIKCVAQELLKLITVCVRQEQHYMDYYPPCQSSDRKTWGHVIKIIASNLKNSRKQHFYNLSYLDSLLSCLVHLTATLDWSESKAGSKPKEPLPQLILSLCELVRAFHSGKGPSAAVSVMGLSITRHVLLVLNHILAEVQNSKVKGWETCFFDDIEENNPLHSFIALWACRDVVLRAASLQLFAGLTSSPRAAIEIVHEIKTENNSIWDLALRILLDHTEASAVRENAAELLSNLTSHSTPLGVDKSSGTSFALKKSSTMTLFTVIDQYDFYMSLEFIFTELYILNVPFKSAKSKEKTLRCYSESDQSWTSSSEESNNNLAVSTPGLVKTVSNFLHNLLCLDSDTISRKMQDHGLVKLLFRAICNPCMSVTNTRELSLYCDLLEMDTSICSVLLRLASSNISCLGTILHTKDCLNTLISLLNPKVFHMNLPQLIYLRNKLWTSIFNLLSTLIEPNNESEEILTNRSIEVVGILSGTLTELGHSPFIETVCESISNLGTHDLQNSALKFLTCMLRVEAYRHFTELESIPSKSIQSLLDTVKTTRSVVLLDNKTSTKSVKSTKNSLESQKMNVLEEIYFGKVFSKPDEDINEDIEVSIIENNDGLLSGAEICKILLFLYDLSNLKETSLYYRKKGLITKALASLLCISKEAKAYALEKNLVQCVIKQFRDHHIRLNLESVECLRRVSDKKRLCPMLKEIDDLVCLMTNFMVDDGRVKVEAASLNLADIIHKLWVWFIIQSGIGTLTNVLKMICTYTTGCDLACQTLPLTSPLPGGGPRKSPGVISLLHAIIALINKQMEQISKTHDLNILEITFNILHNACQSIECRVLISKSNIFQSVSRLHPAITKRQKPWESIELLWLDFLQTFTSHPEGQASVAKITEVLELVLTLTNSYKINNKLMAMLVLRNISFYQSNKARLLSSAEFLNVLLSKLSSGTDEEKNIVVIIMWTLAANSQKAKIILKGVHLDDKLQNILRHYQLVKEGRLKTEDVNRMSYVLGILRDNNDKVR